MMRKSERSLLRSILELVRSIYFPANIALSGYPRADACKQTLGRLLDILDIERDELGASERARKAEQQNGAVA